MKSAKHLLTSFALGLATLTYGQTEDASPLSWSAYFDGYFAYDFNKPRDHNRQYTNMAARHNEFNINHAYFMGSYEGDNLRSEIGLQVGTYADFNYAAEPSEIYKLIYKAYAGVKLAEGVWLDMGVFPGHTGYEAVESLNNEIYTRALTTEYTPYYETGARLTAELSDKVTLTTVVLNGWQNIAETNKSKAFGMNINYKASDKVELNYGNYFGDEGTRFTSSKYRIYNHFYIRHQLTDKWHYMAGIDYATQEPINSNTTESFSFITIITQYRLSEKFSIAARFEEVDDSEQLLINTEETNGFDGQVYTFNLNYHIHANAMFRIEAKHYNTRYDIFTGGPQDASSTSLLAASLAVMLD